MVVDVKALLMNEQLPKAGLAHYVCALGINLIDNPYFARAAIRILILAKILLGHFVYVRIGALFRAVHNASTNRKMTVRIVRVHEIQSNSRIAPHIFIFDAALCGIDEDVLAIIVDPDRRHLRSSVRHDCRELCKRFLLD